MQPVDLKEILRQTERYYVALALEAAQNNHRAAARLLQMPRPTFIDAMKRHGFKVGPVIEKRPAGGHGTVRRVVP